LLLSRRRRIISPIREGFQTLWGLQGPLHGTEVLPLLGVLEDVPAVVEREGGLDGGEVEALRALDLRMGQKRLENWMRYASSRTLTHIPSPSSSQPKHLVLHR